MKNSKSIILAIFACFIALPFFAQKENILHRELGIRIGTSFTTYNESQFSAMTKKYIQPKVGLVYIKMNDKKREELLVSYSSTFKPSNSKNLWYKIINPEVNYTYQRKIEHTWIGGFYQSSTLLNFAKNGQRLFGNNNISYTIANSLGVAADFSKILMEKNNSYLSIAMGTKISLLSHVVRPAYAHPYPEHYLQEDVFTPTRDGLGKSIFKSGKIRTIDKYQSIKLIFSLNYYHKNHLKIGINYEGNFQNVREGKRANYKSQDLTFSVSYIY